MGAASHKEDDDEAREDYQRDHAPEPEPEPPPSQEDTQDSGDKE